MKKTLSLIFLILLAVCIAEGAKYPDYYYQLAGLVGTIESNTYREWGTFKEQRVKDQDFYFGPFWEGEYEAACKIKEIIESLPDREAQGERIKIIREDRPALSIRSGYLKRILDSFYIQNEYGSYCPNEPFFKEASDEQILLFLEGVYLRWGKRGENVIVSPKVSIEHLISFLGKFSLSVESCSTHLVVPGGIQIVFLPEVRLRERLKIKTLVGIEISPLTAFHPERD